MKHLVLGIFAQVDAGKTTLSEALLYRSGQIRKLGRVDHGDAFLDHFALERERGITIFSKQARFPIGEIEITLLDTPGHVDFSPEAERAMQVLDYAVVVVSGTDGVQAHTETLWKLLRRYHIPTFLFFNKMDLPGADRAQLLQQAGRLLNEHCLELADTEAVALTDEAALAEYLEHGTLRDETVAFLIKSQALFPCFFGAALHLQGVDEFLDALGRLTICPVYPKDFAARVYKISRDAQGARLTWLKITGGSLRVRAAVAYTPQNSERLEEKVTQLRRYSGAGFLAVDEVSAGDVCAVTGLTALYAGDVLGAEKAQPSPVLTPVMTYRLDLPPECDVRVALGRLRQLEEEEPQLHIAWNEQLREVQLQLMGEVQLEILRSLIRDRFGWEVRIGSGRVTYRETIAAPVEGIGHFEPLRHYAEVHLLLQPLPYAVRTCSTATGSA